MLITRTIYDTAETICLIFWVVWLVAPSFWNHKSSILNRIINITSSWWRKFWLLFSDNEPHWLELCHQGHYLSLKYEPITLQTQNLLSTTTLWMYCFFVNVVTVFCSRMRKFCSQIRWYETELNEWIVFSFQNRFKLT